MQNVNIEQIMQEIRTEITEKGYTNDMLSFSDVIVDTNDLSVHKFDKVVFNEELYSLNHSWDVQAYRPIIGGGSVKSKIATFVKKVIRKFVKFYVEPIAEDQSNFNALTVKLFNLVECYMNENKVLQERVEKLEAEIEEMKKSVK